MYTSIVRRSVTLFALVTSFCIADVALGSETEDSELPTQLINTPDTDDLNGACSKCRVTSLASAQTATEDDATLEIYYADERDSLYADVELTVLLDDGTYHVETIEGVELVSGELTVLELDPESGWSWRDDVEHLWVEVVPSVG
jgi:hypothetical protein